MNLFLGDSAGLPRPYLRYEDTILHHVASSGDTWIIAHTGDTVSRFRDIVQELSEFLPYGFFYRSVIMLGLSDCAPRPVAVWYRKWLNHVPSRFRLRLSKWLYNHRAWTQKWVGYPQRTPHHIFKKDFMYLINLVKNLSCSVVVVTIPPVMDVVDKHSPGIRREIIKYNQTMREVCTKCGVEVIDHYKELELNPDLNLTTDAHMTLAGHGIVIGGLNG